ncbi:MAG: hypothetical protein KJ879_00905 [Nanoarchaeota archaeon]|nr:hypothetical protein [Nanoarchaeota archaeon]
MASRTQISNKLKLPLHVLDTFKGRIATAISAAFAFVIALSWNDTIKAGVTKLIQNSGLNGTSYIYSIVASLVITVICVFGIYLASKLASNNSEEKLQKK